MMTHGQRPIAVGDVYHQPQAGRYYIVIGLRERFTQLDTYYYNTPPEGGAMIRITITIHESTFMDRTHTGKHHRVTLNELEMVKKRFKIKHL